MPETSTNSKLLRTEKPKGGERRLAEGRALIELLFARDGLKASHIVVPAGTELPATALPDDAVIVVVRGTGIVYVQQEPRHVEAGGVIDLMPHEEHSIEALEELEVVIVEGALASHALL
jgi:quercetin dioxygenase-like cupin family protein